MTRKGSVTSVPAGKTTTALGLSQSAGMLRSAHALAVVIHCAVSGVQVVRARTESSERTDRDADVGQIGARRQRERVALELGDISTSFERRQRTRQMRSSSLPASPTLLRTSRPT